MKKEFESRKIPMAIGEDMMKRPCLFQFLNKIHLKTHRYYKKSSYELISKLFWEAISKLTPRERETILDYLILNVSARQSSLKNELSKRTIENYRMRIKKKINLQILNLLEVERILNNIKRGKFR